MSPQHPKAMCIVNQQTCFGKRSANPANTGNAANPPSMLNTPSLTISVLPEPSTSFAWRQANNRYADSAENGRADSKPASSSDA